MPRPEKPIDLDGPVADFATELRELRKAANMPTYRAMGKKMSYSPTTLSEAASGKKLPTWEATEAYVEACGGDPLAWRWKWKQAHATVIGSAQPEITQAVVGTNGVTKTVVRKNVAGKKVVIGKKEVLAEKPKAVLTTTSPERRRIAIMHGRPFREWSTDAFTIAAFPWMDNDRVAPAPVLTSAELDWPNPDLAVGPDDFGPLLNQLRERAGLSFRQLETEARARALMNGDSHAHAGVGRSTLNDVLNGRRRPNLRQIGLIVSVCTSSIAEQEKWESAWVRVAEYEARAAAALRLLQAPLPPQEERPLQGGHLDNGHSAATKSVIELRGRNSVQVISLKRYKVMLTTMTLVVVLTSLILSVVTRS